jgi:hypothetical protein
MKAKTQFEKLSNAEKRKVESEYHMMKAKEFDETMSSARPHTPAAIHLPVKLIETLKAFAESAGERQYQTMVKRWIEERLHQEANAAS